MAALLFISFIVLLLIGVPVAFAIAAAALLVLLKGDVKLLILVQRMFASTDSFSLIAVPFFIFAGDLLAKGKVSKVLVEFAESLLGMLKGGLSIVSVLAGMFFAAISGSGAATTAAVGATLIPELKKRGYREDSAAALIAAAGTIGVVIPPSVPMVLYAVISEDSVNTLFKNGFVPGILMGVILVAISLYQARKFNYPKGKAFSVGNVLHTFKEAIWGILMPLIILGGIFSGYFTPSEAAAVAVIYAIFVSFFIYRDLDFKGLVEIMKGSAKTSAVIMIIIACSGPFGWVLANRVKSKKWGKTISDVIYADGQFPGASSGLLDKYLAKGPSKSCIKATKDALSGSNNIGDYLYFKSAKRASTGSYSSYKIVGGNCFYKK